MESINKKPKFTVSLHLQGSEMDSPRSIFPYTLPGQSAPMHFKRTPEITQENVSAFQSFPAEDGNGFGVALRLDFRGTNALESLTRTHAGEVVLQVVNRTPVSYVTITKPVTDGVLIIWEGVPDPVVKLMAKKWPPIKKLKSVSTGQEMLPSTQAEKRHSLSAAQQEKAAEDEARRRGGKKKPASDSLLPQGPATQQIPPEGNNQEQPLRPIRQ